METVTSLALQKFFQRLGEQISTPATFYLLGGSALCLLGSPRETLDVDYSIEGALPEMEQALKQLSAELELDLELVPLGEFIPLPPDDLRPPPGSGCRAGRQVLAGAPVRVAPAVPHPQSLVVTTTRLCYNVRGRSPIALPNTSKWSSPLKICRGTWRRQEERGDGW